MPLAGDPPRDRGVSTARRFRQRLRTDRNHLVADRARSRRPSAHRHARRRSSSSSCGSTRSAGRCPTSRSKCATRTATLLPTGQVGEIVIRTPRIMKGYAGREDDAALGDGWRATGDLGWIDEDGYVFFAGRKDDMIIRGGENIAPAEIETVLMSHPASRRSRGDRHRRRSNGARRSRRSSWSDRAQRLEPRRSESSIAARGWRASSGRRRSNLSTRCPRIRSARFCARICVRKSAT